MEVKEGTDLACKALIQAEVDARTPNSPGWENEFAHYQSSILHSGLEVKIPKKGEKPPKITFKLLRELTMAG